MKFKTIIGSVSISTLRKSHIIQRHPIMEIYFVKLRSVLEQPDEVRFSNYSNDVLLIYRYFGNIEGGKYIVAVVSKTNKEIKTAYLSHRIKTGRKYEKKK